MTNGEKYENEIIKIINNGFDSGDDDYLCNNFIKTKILPEFGLECKRMFCGTCNNVVAIWASKKYKEPEVNWSNVKVDFPFKKSELNILSIILSEKESELKEDFKSKDPRKFVDLIQLKAKIDGYIWMMDEKGRAVKRKKEE